LATNLPHWFLTLLIQAILVLINTVPTHRPLPRSLYETACTPVRQLEYPVITKRPVGKQVISSDTNVGEPFLNAKHFTDGVAQGFTPGLSSNSLTCLHNWVSSGLNGIRNLLGYLGRFWPALVVIVFAAAFSSYLRVYVPLLIGNAVKSAVSKNAGGAFLTDAMLIVIISAVAAALQFAVGYGGQWLGQKIVYTIRKDLFNSIQSKSFRFHDNNSTGDLMSRSTMDVEAVRRLIAFGAPQFLTTTLLIVIAVYDLYRISFDYTVVFLAALPILLFLTLLLAVKQEPHWDAIREKYGKMSNVLQENIMGHRIVRVFTAEDDQIRKFGDSTADYLDSYSSVSRVRSILSPLLPLVVSVATASLFVYGGPAVVLNPSAVGSLAAAINIYVLVSGPIGFYGQLVLLFENGMAGMKRIVEVMDSPTEVAEDPSGLSAQNIKGEVVFEKVSFAYKNQPVLKDVSAVVRPGEVVALVGESGSGKTSLANLVPRFYDATSGRVLIDGVDVKKYNVKSLRKRIGFVSQDVMLFSGTIKENIAFGADNAKKDQIREAARKAQIADFIESLPQGYDAVVGERGITLSGGQRQRIAIARALLVDPKILVLDDSTSNVDVETELRLQLALRSVVQGRTTFLISHRISTLKLANRILVFKHGRIVEQGTLQQLLSRDSEFKRIFSTEMEFPIAASGEGDK
jgi:ABC-type multidrug transport system fused ATPase/permease subunit